MGGRDLVREFVAACRAQGVLPGLYFTAPDPYTSGVLGYPQGSVRHWVPGDLLQPPESALRFLPCFKNRVCGVCVCVCVCACVCVRVWRARACAFA